MITQFKTPLLSCFLLLFIASVPLLAADPALEKTIERAKEKRTLDISKASRLYHDTVDRANASLIRILESALSTANRKNDDAQVQALSAQIEALKAGESPTSIGEGDKLLEGAAARRISEIEKADKVFKIAIERANTSLTGTYNTVITAYKRKSDSRSDELTTELASIKAETVSPTRSETDSASAAPKGNGNQGLIKMIGPNLVTADGKNVTSALLADKEYVLIYYSASWCGPCRAFTPDLVKFHKDYAKQGKIEVILVSSDNSEADMVKYMGDGKMPWLAAPYAKGRQLPLNQQHSVRGIPHLALMDKEGNLVSNAVENGQYVGPRKVLEDLKKKLGVR